MATHAPIAHGLLDAWTRRWRPASGPGPQASASRCCWPSASPTQPCWRARRRPPGGRARAGDRARRHRRGQCRRRRAAPGGLGGPGRPDRLRHAAAAAAPRRLGCDAATAASLPAGLKSALLPGEGVMSDVKDISTTGGRIKAWLDMHLVRPRRDPRGVQQPLRPGRRHVPLQPAQPGADPQVPAEVGLKSIINLRGPHGYGSYALEREACEKLGVVLHDVKLYSRAPPEKTAIYMMDEPLQDHRIPRAVALQIRRRPGRPGRGAVPHPAPGPPGRRRDGRARLRCTATSRAPRPACWTSSSPPTWPATPGRPSAFRVG